MGVTVTMGDVVFLRRISPPLTSRIQADDPA